MWVVDMIITYKFNTCLSKQMSAQPGLTECIVLLTLLHYFNLTNFFWMMVEGIYCKYNETEIG